MGFSGLKAHKCGSPLKSARTPMLTNVQSCGFALAFSSAIHGSPSGVSNRRSTADSVSWVMMTESAPKSRPCTVNPTAVFPFTDTRSTFVFILSVPPRDLNFSVIRLTRPSEPPSGNAPSFANVARVTSRLMLPKSFGTTQWVRRLRIPSCLNEAAYSPVDIVVNRFMLNMAGIIPAIWESVTFVFLSVFTPFTSPMGMTMPKNSLISLQSFSIAFASSGETSRKCAFSLSTSRYRHMFFPLCS